MSFYKFTHSTLYYISANISGSNSSIRGDHYGEEEPPVARAELR